MTTPSATKPTRSAMPKFALGMQTRLCASALTNSVSTCPRLLQTLGSLAVEYLMKVWVRERIDHAVVTGQLMTRVKRFNRRAGRYITKRKLQRVDRYENNRHHAE